MTMLLRPADNPFRVDRLHALEFRLPGDATWESLLRNLQRVRFRAAIVGAHGSGKTTLLHALAPRLEAIGFRPRMIFRSADVLDGSDDGYGQPWDETIATLEDRDVLLVDGYGHLPTLSRLRLRSRAAKAAGIIATAHARCDLPTILDTETSPTLLDDLVRQLTGQGLDAAENATLYARHRGNLRDALRELYDRAAG